MSHPPIPPNCERFRTKDGVDQFATWDRRDGTVEDWDDIDLLWGTEFRNCRNEARCAWLDEIERMREAAYQQNVLGETHAPTVAAWQNAEAWRKWGESEEIEKK